jgi:two-component system, sensor histidine kinase and response regulator
MNKTDTRFKILVVDDNPRNIQVIGTILREANYDVGFAMDGTKALEMLHDSSDYDLVLLDIRMPEPDGYEVCKIMKADVLMKEIPIIFLSASHDPDSIVTAFDIGGVDYVTKPFNTRELLARVHTHVQLKQKTLEIQEYVAELEKANATKDKFFSIIAHDLRNPFEGILLISRSLLTTLPACSVEEIKKRIDMVVSAAEGGSKLLENLLIWSRSQTGNIPFKPKKIQLHEEIQSCIDTLSSQAKAKAIKIIYKAEAITVLTDEAMFSIVLRNLLTNAIKFTPSPGKVKVQTALVDGALEVSVTDTGLGISEGDKSRLFRIDGNISSRPGTSNEMGSGLGLILCKEFLDKMGGTIRFESEQNKGTRFTFSLPVT